MGIREHVAHLAGPVAQDEREAGAVLAGQPFRPTLDATARERRAARRDKNADLSLLQFKLEPEVSALATKRSRRAISRFGCGDIGTFEASSSSIRFVPKRGMICVSQ
jgi:hypothetical protein